MKILRLASLALFSSALLFTAQARAAEKPAGYFDFAPFVAPAKGDLVEINIEPSLLSIVGRVAQAQEPEAADLIKGLKLVRINVVKLDDGNRESTQKSIASVRARLVSDGWLQVVTVHDKKGDDVNVHVKTRGDEAIEGLVVTVLSGDKEAVFINILGDVKPEALAKIGTKFDIDPLKHCSFKVHMSAGEKKDAN